MGKPRRTLILEKRLHSGGTAPRQYLTGIDILHGHVCVPTVYLYKKGFDVEVAEKAMREVLRHYPHVCGRYKKDEQGFVYNDGQDHGVDWRVYRCEGPTPYGEHKPLHGDLKYFHKSFMPWQVVGKDQALIQFHINQFDDGGVMLVLTIVHSTFDGSSLFPMLINWSKVIHGQPVEPATFDRQVMIDAGKTKVDTSDFKLLYKPGLLHGINVMARLGWRALTSVRKEIVRIPARNIEAWKAQAQAELPDARGINTGKLVTAYVLKALSPTMPKGVPRSVGMAMDMRYVKGLSLPRNYFGNGLCYGQVHYTEEELATESLAVLADRCKPPASEVSLEAVTKLLTLTERARQAKDIWRYIFKPAVDTLQGGIVQNNLSLLPMYEIDLGRGCPDWYETFAMTIRMMAMTPTPQKDGGIDLHMAASKAEMAALRRQMAADGIPT